jgi:hypothetical protein
MATNGKLNDMEQWRSVVEYQKRKRNPAHHWRDNRDVPQYLEEWDDELHTDVRGPYQSAENARRQASRDAAAHVKGSGYPRMTVKRLVRVAIEHTSLAWAQFDVRDAEKGWGA